MTSKVKDNRIVAHFETFFFLFAPGETALVQTRSVEIMSSVVRGAKTVCTVTAKSRFLQVGGRVFAIIAASSAGGSKGGAAPCQRFPLTAMSPSDRAKNVTWV